MLKISTKRFPRWRAWSVRRFFVLRFSPSKQRATIERGRDFLFSSNRLPKHHKQQPFQLDTHYIVNMGGPRGRKGAKVDPAKMEQVRDGIFLAGIAFV